MFLGTFTHSLDEKNRIIVPSKYRDELQEEFILTKGLEHCLFLYPKKRWEEIVGELNRLSFTKKDARNFMRVFYSGATTLELDKQGRIMIPQNLIEYASLKKNCIILGVSDRIEIWSEEAWTSFVEKYEPTYEELAEDLFKEGDAGSAH